MGKVDRDDIRRIIKKDYFKYRYLLWKDELGDAFLLLKYAEVYQYSKKELGVYCWSPQMYRLVKKKTAISGHWRSDDKLDIFRVKSSFLPELIALGIHKRRPDVRGNWIRDKEDRLGHCIIPLRVETKEGNDEDVESND